MTKLIDKSKISDAINNALNSLKMHGALAELGLALDPTLPEFIKHAGKNEGARQCLEALLKGIVGEAFDAEDMDEAAPEEEPARFGVFLNEEYGGARSVVVSDTFSTRSAAWKAVKDAVGAEMTGAADFKDYEVRPL
jgi:hypothetical protein